MVPVRAIGRLHSHSSRSNAIVDFVCLPSRPCATADYGTKNTALATIDRGSVWLPACAPGRARRQNEVGKKAPQVRADPVPYVT